MGYFYEFFSLSSDIIIIMFCMPFQKTQIFIIFLYHINILYRIYLHWCVYIFCLYVVVYDQYMIVEYYLQKLNKKVI